MQSNPLVIEYTETDFIMRADNTDSTFDLLLKRRWNEMLTKDVFRYKVTQNSLSTKVIPPGKYNLIAQLNEGRGALRRRPHSMSALQMPFDDSKFNFTKIRDDEILLKLKCTTNSDEATIIINSSPIEFCNSLLVPHLEERKPQVLTAESLRLAFAVLLLSSRRSLRLGFNSLGAMASVNHLHWHLYYYEHELNIETLPIVDNILTEWPIEGIVFEMCEISSEEINKVVEKILKIVNHCLIDGQIAHNLFMTRTRSDTIRLFLWTREPLFGAKDDMEIGAAFCEFTGFFMCKTKEQFESIDEDFCVRLLGSVNTRLNSVKHLLN